MRTNIQPGPYRDIGDVRTDQTVRYVLDGLTEQGTVVRVVGQPGEQYGCLGAVVVARPDGSEISFARLDKLEYVG